jgi:hypothetical protein
MRFLKETPARWIVPTALAAVLVAGLLISPAIGVPKFITGKKVGKTIAKKTNATQLATTTAHNVTTAQSVIASLNLNPGSYVVSSTFDARRNTPPGGNIACILRINGVGQDQSNSFSGGATPSAEDTVAMSVSGRAAAATQAQLLCQSDGTGVINHAEITALKVPKVKTLTAP